MDPTQCLHLADLAISDARYADALEHLDNYLSWRACGGFEPSIAFNGMTGDDFAAQLAARVRAVEKARGGK